jgi:hypothetical protein
MFVLCLISDENFWKKNITTKKFARHLVCLENKINPLRDSTAEKIMKKLGKIILDVHILEARTIQLKTLLTDYLAVLKKTPNNN